MLPYNQWFYCDLDNLIKYWFYGHTHTPLNVKIHNIPLFYEYVKTLMHQY